MAVEEHPVRGVVVGADRRVVTAVDTDRKRDLGEDVGVELGADLDALQHLVAVQVLNGQHDLVAVARGS